MYLCSWLVDHREALSPTSNRVNNNSNPRYLRISPSVVGVFPFACSSRLVSRFISCSFKGGNVRRDISRAERSPMPPAALSVSPVGVRNAHGLY
jgi:hypothetical protein